MTCHSTFHDGLVSASTEQLLSCFCGYSVSDFLTLSSLCFSVNQISGTHWVCNPKLHCYLAMRAMWSEFSENVAAGRGWAIIWSRTQCRAKDKGPNKGKASHKTQGCTLPFFTFWSMGFLTFVFHETVKYSSEHWESCLSVSNFLFS